MSRDLSIVAVIPLYNGGKYIETSLKSILAQALGPDEIVVVDDGSWDDGAEVVRRHAERDPRIRLLSKPNGGQSSARNLGVASSSAALIAFLDQDDAWYPDHLEKLVEPFRSWQGGMPLGWVYSDLDDTDETGDLLTRALLARMPVEHPKSTLVGCLSTDMHILPSASLIARSAFDHVGGFDESLSGYEDDDLFLRLFRKGYHNVFLREPLSIWRKHSTSTSFSPRMAASRNIYIRKLIAHFPNDPRTDRHFVRDCVAPRFFRNAIVRYFLALRLGDTINMTQARSDLRELTPHLPVRLRAQALLLRPILAVPVLARGTWVIRDVLKAVSRR